MSGKEHDRDHESRLDDAAAYALGGLDAGETAEFERHLEGCERCQAEIRWLKPGIDALSTAVPARKPPPALRAKLMSQARRDAAKQARAGARAAAGASWWRRLPGLSRGSGTGFAMRPAAGLAAAALIIAIVAGYAIGTGGSDEGSGDTTVVSRQNGVVATMVDEGDSGTLRLANVRQLPSDRVLEAWVQREGEVEAVRALFVPDREGRASTQLPDMTGVEAVMVTTEPEGGSEAPTSAPMITLSVSG